MKVFYARNESVDSYVTVSEITIAGGSVKINAVVIGEEGRGRTRGVLPVEGCAAGQKLTNAVVGQTKSGRPKLIAISPDTDRDTDEAIVVLATMPGNRGGTGFRGDRKQANLYSWTTELDHYGLASGLDEVTRELLNKSKLDGITLEQVDQILEKTLELTFEDFKEKVEYEPFPCQIIVTGHTAQGLAGHAGGGDQHVVIAKRGEVFRVSWTGGPDGGESRYMMFDGTNLYCVTWDERQIADLF